MSERIETAKNSVYHEQRKAQVFIRLIKTISKTNILVILIIFSLALFSRLYNLNGFPFFSPGSPSYGTGDETLKGLYIDEYATYMLANNLVKDPFHPTTYEPWLQLLMISASITIFGLNSFATRFPSAIMSSLTAVLIYMICTKKFGNRTASLFSTLFFIVMTPALILNRMAFTENGTAFFFVFSYFCLLEYSETRRERWHLLGAVLAGLSFLSKMSGIVAVFFYIIYLIRSKNLMKGLKYIITAIALILVFPLTLMATYNISLSELLSKFLTQWAANVGTIGREFSLLSYMLLRCLPSGNIPTWTPAPWLEYWYIFAYFAIAYVAITDLNKISDELIAIMSFIITFLLIGGINSYYLIIIQPFLAIPVGNALTKMKKMSSATAMVFYILFYTSMIIHFNNYLTTPSSSGSSILPISIVLVLKYIQLGTPLIPIILSLISKERFSKDFKPAINIILIAIFLILLTAGSYLLPIFYPTYFPPAVAG